jgi:ferrochelatase
MDQTAVILVNVGTPDSPKVADVRRYLFEFLNDPRVIDLPWLLRKVLVNLVIVPLRAPRSAKLYSQLWNDNGSLLLYYSREVTRKLQLRMGADFQIYNAMRYGSPSLNDVLKRIELQNYKKIIVLPLFPQYASATTGSVLEFILSQMSHWNTIPQLQLINHFYDHPAFTGAFALLAAKYNLANWDHVIFSFHGLPLRQISKVHPGADCTKCLCKTETIEKGKFCYQASCYETARLIAHKIGLSINDYSISFQSRLTKNWMSPFTDETLIQKAKSGIKKILILAPSFVADCLETKIEVEKEYSALFIRHGGEQLQLVESLNDHDSWIEGLNQIITGQNEGHSSAII